MATRAGRDARAPSSRAGAALLLVGLIAGGSAAEAAPPPGLWPRPGPSAPPAPATAPPASAPATARPAPATAPATPPVDDGYVESLVRRARDRGLARATIWLRLGHWRTSLWRSGYRSEVDGPELFLAPGGASDPAAELDATLRGFFAPVPRNPDQHAVCRFPARFQWLHRQLGLDLGRIRVDCPGFRKFLDVVRPRSISVVFSSYFLARAASAFGHTFLRVERFDPLATEERHQLLDIGIDYAATVDTGNAVLYALRGLTGLFQGRFKRLPYYYKVREYNDYESRDLWEYELALRPDQVFMVLAHIWELGHTWFDYYYLTENCSYHILGAIEVADPRISLLEHVRDPVIPSDTIKALYRNPGLVRRVTYRPSLETQFQARVRGMSGAELSAVQRLAADPAAPLPALTDRQRIAVLDAAADLIDMRFADDIVFDPRSEGRRRKQQLLERRSDIQVPSPPLEVATPWRKAPHLSHGSRRIGLGVGSSSQRDLYGRMSFRLALHDMADAPDGYPELISFEFLPMSARFPSTGDGPISLEEIYLLRIRHLNEWTRFNRRPSWDVRIGARALREPECRGCVMGEVAGGAGWGTTFAGGRLALVATVDTLLGWNSSLGGVGDSGLRVGFGPSGAVRATLTHRTALLFSGEWFWLPDQERDWIGAAALTLRAGIGTGSAIDLELTARPGEPSATLGWLFYY